MTSLPEDYLEWFIGNALRAINDYPPFMGTAQLIIQVLKWNIGVMRGRGLGLWPLN